MSPAVAGELEVLTVGRISVDLYCPEPGADFASAASFVKALGGSPTNVAVAAARLGHRTAVATKVGADPFGEYLLQRLDDFGVDRRWAGVHPNLRTPLAFAVATDPDEPRLLFYREPMAPDLTLDPSDVDPKIVAEVPVLWVTGTGVSAQPSRSTTMGLLRARGRRSHTIVDLDYRACIWNSEADAATAISAMVDHASVVVGNRAECAVALGTTDPEKAAARLVDRGVALAVIKMGAEGVLVATADGQEVVPPCPVSVVCGLGAGDAFGGALIHGLLSGWTPIDAVRFANAAGALVASRLLCSDAMGGQEEIAALMQRDDAPTGANGAPPLSPRKTAGAR